MYLSTGWISVSILYGFTYIVRCLFVRCMFGRVLVIYFLFFKLSVINVLMTCVCYIFALFPPFCNIFGISDSHTSLIFMMQA